jgi:threonine dehydrogenase-like Zn-dependent dehydrogenase
MVLAGGTAQQKENCMRGAILHAPGDVRCEERPDPRILEPTDAIVRTVATCVCGSDLWPYRGIDAVRKARPIGHEFCGIVEQVGDAVTAIKPGQFVIGGFSASDNTCPPCRAGMHISCEQSTGYDGCQSEFIRIPLADGTLVGTPEQPPDDLVPSLLTLSDVMATGWHAAVSAGVGPGMTVAVVGDGAVGLSGVLAASQLSADRVIAMSRHEQRQQLAKEFGASDIVAERAARKAFRASRTHRWQRRRRRPGMCRHRGVGHAGAAVHTPRWHGGLGRRPAWGRGVDGRHVLAECRRTRRPGAGTQLLTGSGGSGLERHDRAGQSI